MDIGWAGMAGDEMDIVQRYADRIATIHLKDFYAPYLRSGFNRTNIPAEAFAPIGSGAVATAQVLQRLNSLPQFTGNLIIDQDESRIPMLEALKTGFDNVKAMF
jgi:sugar phosphate isomerase/epimerase